MPRFYGTIMRPSTNKAATPGQERKGVGKPLVPPKSDEKKDEGGKK